MDACELVPSDRRKAIRMYSKNSIAKRRPSGWAERRRHFRNFFLKVRAKAPKGDEILEAAPVIEKD